MGIKSKNPISEAEAETLTFERLPNEPYKAYTYFCTYRDLGGKRSLKKTAEAHNVTMRAIVDYSTQYHWGERIKLWVDEIDRIKREAYINEVKEMAKRHAQQSMAYQKVLIMPVEAILKKIKSNEKSYKDFQNLPVETLFDKSLRSAQMLSTVVDIERKSRGEPSEIIKQDIEQTQNNEIKIVLPAIPDHLKNIIENNEADTTESN